MAEEIENTESTGTPRRQFFRALASLGSGAAATLVGLKVLESKKVEAAEVPPQLAESTGNVVVRMQRDLEETFASSGTPSWAMVVDTRKCIGCDACSVACRAENPTGPAGNYRRVIQRSAGPSAGPWAIFKPVNCLQCDNPPCARAVPKGMILKRPDGIVELDYAGLRGPYAIAAAKACPFGALHVDDGKTFTQDTPVPQAYEQRTFFLNGQAYNRKPGANPLAGAARKCTFCSHRLDVGLLPACVTTCVGGAMYFGDVNNPSSLVNEITQGRRVFRGHQDMGVKPRVIYFEEPMPDATHLDCSVCHD